jgi:hypothetical protein
MRVPPTLFQKVSVSLAYDQYVSEHILRRLLQQVVHSDTSVAV